MNRLLTLSPASMLDSDADAAFEPHEIALKRGDHWKVRAERPTRFNCLRGSIWLTTEGDPTDVVLKAGDEWECESWKLTVLGALSDSIVQVGRPC